MRVKNLLLSIALVLLITYQGFSQFKAIESFDYPVGTSLDTLIGSAENGWGGPWDMFDGNYEVMTVVDTGFAYGDLNFEVPNKGNLFMGANPSAWGWQRYGRYLDKTWPNEAGKVYWISCLYELKNFTNNGWALVSVFEGSNERAGIGHEWGNDSLGIATYNTAGHSPYLSHDGPQWLVAKIVMTGDTLGNPVYFWVSPDPNGAEPDTNAADAKGKWRLDNGFDRVAVHFGGEGVGMTMAVDEIRLGATWADVSSPLASEVFKAIESFNYPVGTSLDTLTGGAENGWGGPWDMFDGNYEVMSVVDTGFAYGDLNYEVPNEGNLFMGANPSAWGWQRYGRYLANPWPNEAGRIYWMSCLYELKNYTDNGWALVSVFEGANERAGIGHEWGNDSLGIATYNTAGHSTYLSHDGPQWLVAKIVMTGDTLGNPVYLWVSPDPAGAEPDTTVADARGKWRLDNGFDRVAVHWGGEGVGMTMAVDEIRLGTTWTDISSPLTDVSEPGTEIPTQFGLSQNYPNPFNPATRITYSIETSAKVRLAVYDLLGREIAVLFSGEQNAGTHEVTFNAGKLTSGIYFYTLQSGNRIATKKMTLLK